MHEAGLALKSMPKDAAAMIAPGIRCGPTPEPAHQSFGKQSKTQYVYTRSLRLRDNAIGRVSLRTAFMCPVRIATLLDDLPATGSGAASKSSNPCDARHVHDV